jgi:hypothetical protein
MSYIGALGVNTFDDELEDTSNILVGRIAADINNTSNYVCTTSNVLATRITDEVGYTSNYVCTTSNILVKRREYFIFGLIVLSPAVMLRVNLRVNLCVSLKESMKIVPARTPSETNQGGSEERRRHISCTPIAGLICDSESERRCSCC